MAKKSKKETKEFDIVKHLESLKCKILNEIEDFSSPYYISTGIYPLDSILNEEGGLPVGCIEVFGPNGSGKTSASLNILANAQKNGKNVFYINMERAINKSLIKCFPQLDPKKVCWVEPEYGQACFDAIEAILRNTPDSFVVLDSVPACISSAMMESSAEQAFMGIIPKLLSGFMPKARTLTRNNKSTLVMLNQIRDNLTGYGAKTFVPGGHSIKFNCDIRIEMKVIKKIQNSKGDIMGQRIKYTTVKNRFMRPFQSAESTLIFGEGFSIGYDLLDIGLMLGVIDKSGAWFEFDGNKYHGQDGIASAINESEDLQQKLIEHFKS